MGVTVLIQNSGVLNHHTTIDEVQQILHELVKIEVKIKNEDKVLLLFYALSRSSENF